MMKISGYFFSLLLLCSVASAYAQDSIKHDIAFMHGWRLGVDVSRLALPLLYDDGRVGMEFTLDKQISRNGFVTAEAGALRMDSKEPGYTYKLDGMYLRLGYDRNIIRFREIGLRDVVYVGMRYGVARFNHDLSDIIIPPGYWEGGAGGSLKKDGLMSHWIEAVVGTKVELMRNFYLGAALRGKIRIVAPDDDYVEPILVPGYGKGNKGLALSFSYTLLYTFDPSGKNR
jgi:hypothetical protein